MPNDAIVEPVAAAPAAAPVLTAASSLTDAAPAAAAVVADPAAPAVVDPAAPPAEAPASLALPGKEATPEQWAEFYAKIGRPETPDAYEIPVPEGDDGAFAKQMAPILHKHGVTAEQAKGLAADYNGIVADVMAAQQAAAVAADQAEVARLDVQNKAEAQALRSEWGQQHDANMHFAKLAVSQFLPGEKSGEVISAIESVLGYKGTIQFLHGVGKGLGEHGAPGLGGNGPSVAAKSAAEVLYGNNAG